jgi:hypothetical protein
VSIDHSDEPGWPAEPTPVHHEGYENAYTWRNSRWREQRNELRRAKYRAAVEAGATWREAKRAASGAA